MRSVKDSDGNLLAIVVESWDRSKAGVKFFTSDDHTQQVASIAHPAGKIIAPHFHNEQPRMVTQTREVLIVRKGRMVVTFFDATNRQVDQCFSGEGDILILISGGHSFEVVEDIEMIEVKQGPYLGVLDKTYFTPDRLDNGGSS